MLHGVPVPGLCHPQAHWPRGYMCCLSCRVPAGPVAQMPLPGLTPARPRRTHHGPLPSTILFWKGARSAQGTPNFQAFYQSWECASPHSRWATVALSPITSPPPAGSPVISPQRIRKLVGLLFLKVEVGKGHPEASPCLYFC